MAERRATNGGMTESWTVANTVTVTRILLIPVFLVLMLTDWARLLVGDQAAANVGPWVAMVLYALISLTDSLDGYLARSRNEITVFGKFMDPIADKLLVISALIVLVEWGSLPSWIPIVIVARELLVSGLRMVVAAAGVVVAASWIGKAKTFVTLVAICLFIIKDTPLVQGAQPALGMFSWALMLVAVVLTVWSMVDYFAKSWPYLVGGSHKSAGSATTASSPSSDEARDAKVSLASLEGLHPLARQVVQQAIAKGVSICTAESCTGGLVAAALTSVSGSSEVVRGGVVSYTEGVKQSLLGVQGSTIQAHGVVSSQTAQEMAAGARTATGADLCVATTGIAGPSGATENDPVGTVWFAVDGRSAESHRVVFEGNREQVRAQAVDYALALLLTDLTER